MCAHLVDRWLREGIFNIFLDKNSLGWSGQECFLSPFKNLYGLTVRIVQGLEHQNLQAKSGMPKFISLLHFQSPFPYYFCRPLRGAVVRISPQCCKIWLLQGHSKHQVENVGFLCCVPGEAASCVEATMSKIHWKAFWHQHRGSHQKWVITLQNSYLFPLFPEVVSAQMWYQTICMKSCWTTLKVSKMTKKRIQVFV